MTANGTIEQRAFDRKAWFNFGEDKVEFGYVDPTGEVKTSAFYEAIDLENKTQVKVKVGIRYLRIAMIVAIALALALSLAPDRQFALIPMLLYAAFVVAIRFGNIASVSITLLPVKTGNMMQKMRIIENKKHDEVIERLRAGWVARIRKLHAKVQLGANPEQESQRFRWMLDQKVIDEAEYERAIALINSASAQPGVDERKLN